MSRSQERAGFDAPSNTEPNLSSEQHWLLLGVLTGEIGAESDLKLRNATPRELEAELRQNHLPKLEAAGYVEWDHDTGEISKGPAFDEIEPLLQEMLEDGDVPLL